MHRLICLAMTALLLAAVNVPPAQAQDYRPDGGWYVSPRIGINTYFGHRDGNTDENLAQFFRDGEFSGAVEIGRASRWGDGPMGGSLGLMILAGRYPMIENNASGILPVIDRSISGPWRYTMALNARMHFNYFGRLSPYLTIGPGITFGQANNEWRYAFSPVVGAGIDIAITERVGFFLDVSQIIAVPDGHIDFADNGLRDAYGTILGFYGGGLRLNLIAGRPRIPMDVFIEGPSQLRVGEQGAFVATVDPGSTRPLSYTWDMGDGALREGLTVRHQYGEPGVYTVRFTARFTRGEEVRTLRVNVIDAGAPPQILAIHADPASPATRSPVRFSAEVRGERPMEYRWDFGDGTTSTQESPAHTYMEPGTYTVTLRVTNEWGADDASRPVTVTDDAVPVCAGINELNSVFFPPNASLLTDEGRRVLRENVDVLRLCPDIHVRLEGYAGPGERNPERLRELRIISVEQHYLDAGIAPERLTRRPMGIPAGVTVKKDGADRWRRVDSIPFQR
jgi:outer membrane protein OmpA-like peptidoglycan-associated protein/opacity protein-like surface antigen